MKDELKKIIKEALLKIEYEIDEVHISKSNIYDYQCNDLFKIASTYHKSPIEIGEELVNTINKLDNFDDYFKEVSFTKPGFFNMVISDKYINKYIKILYQDEHKLTHNKKKEVYVLDYGGANVAKPLHVGHMRTAIVGESIKRIINYMGNTTISDVHLGDFGLQIGEVIYGVLRDKLDINDIDIKYLDKIYPEMSVLVKDNEEIKNECATITKELQDGNQEYIKIWKKILEVSKQDIKKNYDYLNVSFDYWYGESDSYQYLDETEKILNDKNLLHYSENAYVVDVKNNDDKKEIPPLLFKKSNGAYLYASTDLATILQRKLDFHPDHILYIVDNRQSLHFEQVFRTSDKAGIISKDKLEFLGYGTVNGSDGKPYKTRSGNTPKLENLFNDAKNIFISKKENNKNMNNEDIDKIVNAILKFADLSNSRLKDYIFDLNKFSDVTGKTGPYILYTYLRINKILNNNHGDLELDNTIYNEYDRNLRLKLLESIESIELAFTERMPHYIADYVYELCVYANIFYQNNYVLKETDSLKKNNWLYILTVTNKVIKLMLDLLGIEIPSEM